MSSLEDGRWVVVLTQSERMALIDLILEFLMQRNSTEQFIDLAANKTTTPGNLLVAIDERSRWIPDFRKIWEENMRRKRNSENPRAAHG